MPITINGTGSISGVTAGGLPSASVTSATIADANITAAKLDGAQSGSAPIYGARAWVNFNGTSTVAIGGSGNVSSITDNGTGSYTVNFTSAMPDGNYAMTGTAEYASGYDLWVQSTARNTGSAGVTVARQGALVDSAYVGVSFFR